MADIEKLAATKNIEFSKKIRANKEKISNLVKDLNANKISEDEFIKKM